MPKMGIARRTVYWVPEANVSTTADLFKAATYAQSGGSPKAINISCAIEPGYSLGPTESTIDESKTICDEANVETPIQENFEASLTFYREAITGEAPGDATTYDKVFNLFKRGWKDGHIIGYIVHRIGWKSDHPMTAGNIVSAYKVLADHPRDSEYDGTASERYTVTFRPQGWMELNMPLT